MANKENNHKQKHLTDKEIIINEIKKVGKVFDSMIHQRVSPKGIVRMEEELKRTGEKLSQSEIIERYKGLPKDSSKRVGLSYGTKKKYTSKMSVLLKEVNARFGITRFKDIQPEHVQAILGNSHQKYKEGYINESGKSNDFLSAFKAFQLGLNHTNQDVFGKQVKEQMNLGDVGEYRKERSNQGIYRSPNYSAGLKVNQKGVTEVNDRIEKEYLETGNEYAKAAHIVSSLSQYGGTRLAAAINVRPENIVFVENGVAKFHYPLTESTANRRSLKELKKMEDKFNKLSDGVYFQVIDKSNKHNVSKVLKDGEEKIKKIVADFFNNPENRDKKGNIKDVGLIDIRNEKGEKLSNKTIIVKLHNVIKRNSDDFTHIEKREFKTKDKNGKMVRKMSVAKKLEFSHHRNRGAYGMEVAVQSYLKLTGTKEERNEIFNEQRTMDPEAMKKYSKLNAERETKKLKDLPLKEAALFASFALSHYRNDVTNHYLTEEDLRSELIRRGVLKVGH
jgi:hypothetical protein